MPTYQIEMLWKCRVCQCNQLNRGLSKHCANCGHPKDDQDEEFFPADISEANALTGEDKRKAEAGPDFKCKYCGSLQNALNKCCTECGADRETGAKAWKTQELHISQNSETGEKSAVEAHTVEVSENRVVTDVQPEIEQPEPKIQRRAFPFPIYRAWVILPIIGISLLLYLLFRTKIVDVHVTATHWDHKVTIERYQITPEEGWTPSFDAFNIHSLGQRINHYDHVKVGSHVEHEQKAYDCRCHTVKGACHTTPRDCKSNKNGTATCTGGDTVCDSDSQVCDTCYKDVSRTVDDYEDKPVYQTWYGWDEWEWKYNRTVTHQCDEPDRKCGAPSWPSGKELDPPSSLASGEQERSSQSENYGITFSEPDGTTHGWSPNSEAEFEQHPLGSTAKIKVGIAHGVEILH